MKMRAYTEISDDLIKRHMEKGEFGLEKESLRIDENGFLSHTKHPFGEESNITRDFCENQTELITDVFDNVDDVLRHLRQLQTKVQQTLQQLDTGREFLWPFSNPPYVRGEKDIPIAQFKDEQAEKTRYRNYLAEKYGKRKMLFSGIHLNYSLADGMLREGYRAFADRAKAERTQEEIPDYPWYKSSLYMQLARKVVWHSWFIVYLMAASPILDDSFLECGEGAKDHSGWTKEALSRYASVRCGELGYWNDFIPILDYGNLESYIQSIEAYVHKGYLQSVSELYYPVRLKPRGENSLGHLREHGINHMELRMLDVNPLSPVGLFKEDVAFIHYFMLYLLNHKNVELTEEEQILAIQNEKQAAEFDDSQIFIQESGGSRKPVRKAALEILEDMESFYMTLEAEGALENIRYQKDKLLIPDNRYADRLRREFGTDYVKRGVRLAAEYAEEL
ncbi:MAG: hypothetical protein J1F02_05910 [Lachnospiraceae bacterium]|nr:hypothetical protein [Lachnospiraceae bacterium]